MTTMHDLRQWDVPIMNAAGTAKTIDDAKDLLATAIERVMLGSYTLKERAGNGGQTFHDGDHFSLNSLGLPSPALRDWAQVVRTVCLRASEQGKQVWVSVAGFNASEFGEMAYAALEATADYVELNLGCPNIWDGDQQKPIFSFDVGATEEVLTTVRAGIGDLERIGVKLSPIFDSVLLAGINALVRKHEVAFVSAINTLPNAFALDDAERPAILTDVTNYGGMSGAAILPVGLGQVRQHRALAPDLVLLGVGGVRSAGDVIDYTSAQVGANAVQVGTRLWQAGPRVIHEILAGLPPA